MGCCDFLMVKLLLIAMERVLLRNDCVNHQIGAGRLAERGFQKTCSNISLKTNPVNIGRNIKRSMLAEVDLIRISPFPPEPAGDLLLRFRAEVVAGQLLVVHLHSAIVSCMN